MTKAVPAESVDISTKMAYLELLVPSSAEVLSTSKLAQKPVVRSMYVIRSFNSMHKFCVLKLLHIFSRYSGSYL